MDIRNRIEIILNELTENEYSNLFANVNSMDEKLQLLTSESLLALMFISSIEDEFSISFDDDEVDIHFFSSVDKVISKIEHSLKLTL